MTRIECRPFAPPPPREAAAGLVARAVRSFWAISAREVALPRAAGKLPSAARLGSCPSPRGWEVALRRAAGKLPSSAVGPPPRRGDWKVALPSPCVGRGRAGKVALLQCGGSYPPPERGKLPSSGAGGKLPSSDGLGSCPPPPGGKSPTRVIAHARRSDVSFQRRTQVLVRSLQAALKCCNL